MNVHHSHDAVYQFSCRTNAEVCDHHDEHTAEHLTACAEFFGDPPPEDSVDLAIALRRMRSRLERFLLESDASPDRSLQACSLLLDIHRDQSELLHRASRSNAQSVGEVRRVVADLIDAQTTQLIDLVPQRICQSLSFGRAMISSVRSAVWLPRHLHIECDDSPENSAFMSYVDGARIPLSYAPLETEIVRNRSASICARPDDDKRTFKEIVEVSHSVGYVAAPIVSNGRVIGILHADRPNGNGRVDEADLAVLSALSECLSTVFERAILEDRLRMSSARVDDIFGDITAQ
ncbi:GAF domain-containing protein [Gordonia aichiensis]|uniref:GAF domain-containing protein n=1 Tax=Gordonia aichiensis TaxID=36820 RepID=UPI0003467B23|nr:GAF domain-containing protein [Gordonia aichiensis]